MIVNSPPAVAIIPARMGSQRFPGKPLEKIIGMPVVGHVMHRAKMIKNIDIVYVATCDREIFEYIESIGGLAVMTSEFHETATDRAAEALEIIQSTHDTDFEVVALIQGDEPMFDPNDIQHAIKTLAANESYSIVNLMNRSESHEEFVDYNNVKVVVDHDDNAMYFSREPIPTSARGEKIVMNKQICVIPFRRDYLFEYSALTPTPLEISESIDMLRILEHGGRIRMVPTDYKTYAVDSREDLKRVEKMLK